MDHEYDEWEKAAQPFEGRLASLRKSEDGWLIGLSVSSEEMPAGLVDSDLGTEFRVVTFELDGNSRPVPVENKPEGQLIKIAVAHGDSTTPSDDSSG
jgi:hypothetical protein|tara:strand:+ start:887 stop:1177 length:291 start_codon:yes stop_codon:yes gene_type:complete